MTPARLLPWLALLTALGLQAAPPHLVEVVPAEQPLRSRLVLLVDTSGSMRPRMPAVLSAVETLASQPVDELEVLVVAWADDVAVDPQGWVQLPDPEGVAAAQAFLAGRAGQGDTVVVPALERAAAEDADVVLITDGMFSDHRGAGWDSDAVLAVYGLGNEQAVLSRLAEQGRGGYWREAQAPVFAVPGGVQGQVR